MATQTVTPSLCATETPRGAPAGSNHHGFPHTRKSAVTLALLFAALLVGSLFPKLASLLGAALVVVVPTLVSAYFNVLRDVAPARVPSLIEPESPLAARLKRITLVLGGSAATAFLALVLAVFATSCFCEDHPALFFSLLGLTAVGFFGAQGVSTSLKERTPPKLKPGTGAGPHWPSSRRPIGDSQPFRSEHWGANGEPTT